MLEVLGEYKMLSFDENGWLFPDPLKNITQETPGVRSHEIPWQ